MRLIEQLYAVLSLVSAVIMIVALYNSWICLKCTYGKEATTVAIVSFILMVSLAVYLVGDMMQKKKVNMSVLALVSLLQLVYFVAFILVLYNGWICKKCTYGKDIVKAYIVLLAVMFLLRVLMI